MYWLETILVGARRAGAVETEWQLGGFSIVWTVLGLVEIAAFVLLFGVK